MFFACSKDYKGLVEVDNSIENIQIKNGMLVFYTYVLYAQPFFYVEYKISVWYNKFVKEIYALFFCSANFNIGRYNEKSITD